jgi:hypothetical protein
MQSIEIAPTQCMIRIGRGWVGRAGPCVVSTRAVRVRDGNIVARYIGGSTPLAPTIISPAVVLPPSAAAFTNTASPGLISDTVPI